MFALACASHTPMLMDETLASAAVCDTVRQSFQVMADFIDGFAPDQIIQFSPDHFHGFHYDNMPSFCLGAAARSYGDWGTATGALVVDADFALSVHEAVRAAEIDLSVSFDMLVDHGFVQIWEAMWGSFTRYPIVPVFVNAIAHPLPSYRRARRLGEAIGRFAAQSGKRILFAASGGLSHDPVVPMLRGATPEVRDRLIGRAKPTAAQQAQRERQVREAAHAARNNTGPSRPLNSAWDLALLDHLERSDWAFTDSMSTGDVAQIAGSGANETLCWVAATAALAAATPFRVVQKDYLAIPGWIAGMAHMTAVADQE
jgi:2,3-dihydroxyphenylpropionate 1,2-dioxygenase